MNRISLDNFSEKATQWRKPYQTGYYAMYSSIWHGITTDPLLMSVPIDDHLVHRGDGVFEAFKCVRGNIYNLKAHLDRLEDSAASIFLRLPADASVIEAWVLETIRAGGHADCTVRVFVSRGPGGFSVSPKQSPASQLYIVVGALGEPFMKQHPEGAKVRSSSIPVKPPPFSSTKSCNYMPNVLMKHEAETWGVDFTVSFDERDCLGEGATENAGIVTPDRRLLFPAMDRILKGTTMWRVMELAKAEIGALLRDVAFEPIPRQTVLEAAEFILVGTTIDVVAGVEFDRRAVGDGKPGPVSKRLDERLKQDILTNRQFQTPVFLS